MPFISNNIPLQQINDSMTKQYGVNLFVLRIDLPHPPFGHLLLKEKESGNNFLHPHISGNKLFKLKYNIQEAILQNKNTLLTFGGAFSNHIAATAAAGKEFNFKTIGIIRGEEYQTLNPTLKFASDCGMQLHYVSRILYQNKNELYQYVNQLFPEQDIYTIPEGGNNNLGIEGCKEITKNIGIDFDYICCPCGTGATITGIVLSLINNQKAIGFQVLKADNYIKNEVASWLDKFLNSTDFLKQRDNWQINEEHHFGGYAKTKQELTDFIEQFENDNKIPLDPIYTSKMMFGIYDMIQKGGFKKGETIVAVHTGGLQGNGGFRHLKKRNAADDDKNG
jgi:1-aminocyclopropane-1-carboxylate deaminase